MKNTLKSESDSVTETEMPLDLSALGLSTVFRCDRCGAQAYTAVAKDDLMLLFCRHHTNKHRGRLVETGWTIDDRTHLLNENPSVSANV